MATPKIHNALSSGFLTAFWILMLTYILPTYVDITEGYEQSALPPSFWPKVIIIFGLICSIIYFGQSVLAIVKDKKPISFPRLLWQTEKQSIFLMAMLCIYAYLLEYMGLIVTSAIFLPLTAWLYGEKRPLALLVFSLSITAILYVFFVIVAQVHIPAGLWFES